MKFSQKRKIPTTLMSSIVLMFSLLLSSCSKKDESSSVSSAQGIKKASNELFQIGLTQEFENMNPIVSTMLATTWIYSAVGRTLNTIDENGTWVAQLASSIPSLKNGQARIIEKDGKKTIEADWEIKKSAKWGDGTPITGEDVKFSWMLAQSPNITVGEVETYSQIVDIQIDPNNPKKFKTTYDKIRYDFNKLGTFKIVPKHLEEEIFKKFGAKKEGYEKNSYYTANPTNPGLYSGPYLVKELKLGSHIVLERNPHFYGEQAKIKKIILKLIPNTGTLEANLRAKNIDMISVLGFTLDQAIAFENKVKQENLPYNVNFKQGLVYEHIDLNLDNPLLKDKNVRKALVFALDRKKLTESLFEGKQSPAIHNIAPIDNWYTDDPKEIVLYRSSKRKANKLLESAGWQKKDDGFRYKNGEKLSLSLMTTAGNKVRELVQQYLQNEWKQVGVEVKIKNEPARVFFGQTTHKRKFPAMAMYAWISSPENSPKSTFHSKNIPSDKNGWSGQNYPGWSNPEVDKYLDQIESEMDPEKRKIIVGKFLFHYTDDVPVIPLYYRSDISVTPTNLENYSLTGHQFTPTNHIEKWNLK